jgi:hypothetical protein
MDPDEGVAEVRGFEAQPTSNPQSSATLMTEQMINTCGNTNNTGQVALPRQIIT